MKPFLYSQERMSANIIPLPEKEKLNSFAEAFESPDVEAGWKYRWIAQVSSFVTLNGIKKDDLHAALKWLFGQMK